jgi:hypothetical protein
MMKKSRIKKPQSSSRPRNRRMGVESLETRSLMAGDILHNFMMPEDTDGSGSITPLDALVVINRINQSDRAAVARVVENAVRLVDVDADNSLTPLDALVVINQINSSTLGADIAQAVRASRVDVQRRIERIEQAIVDNALPPNLTVEVAEGILRTLRSGGRPELGDRMVDGRMHWREEVVPSVDEPIGDQPADDSSDPHSPSRVDRFVDALSQRLASFGVSSEIIETISDEITAACEADNPLDLSYIRDRLEGLGVDVDSILPQPRPHGHDDQINMPAIVVTEPIAESILTRLRNAGVTLEVIETITTEIWDGIDAGTPLDFFAVRRRLEELGVDWERLFTPRHDPEDGNPNGGGGNHHGGPINNEPGLNLGDLFRRVVPFLIRAGVNREIIAIISNEVRTALSSGTPITASQVLARLREYGVRVDGLPFRI